MKNNALFWARLLACFLHQPGWYSLMDAPGAERESLSEQHLSPIRDFIEGRSLVPERRGPGPPLQLPVDARAVHD